MFFDFILANLPAIICALVGIGLLIFEVFLPGFGVAGLSGVALEITAVVLMARNEGAVAATVLALIALCVAAVVLTVSLRSAAKGKLSRSEIVLNATEQGYASADDLQHLTGAEGEALTVLRPAGIALINGERVNVQTDGEYIPQGTRITVARVDGNRVLVRPAS